MNPIVQASFFRSPDLNLKTATNNRMLRHQSRKITQDKIMSYYIICMPTVLFLSIDTFITISSSNQPLKCVIILTFSQLLRLSIVQRDYVTIYTLAVHLSTSHCYFQFSCKSRSTKKTLTTFGFIMRGSREGRGGGGPLLRGKS